MQVLLDTGEWCPAKISAPKNKNLKYEVMFSGDPSGLPVLEGLFCSFIVQFYVSFDSDHLRGAADKARLPVPTERACLAPGTRVEV